MLHRFLRRFGALVMAVFMAVTVTSAQSGTGWEYDESTKTLTLSGDVVDWSGFCAYDVEKVVFAENFNVAEIPSRAFGGWSSLSVIEIPDCVRSIGEGAFAYCGGLTSISLPEGLQSIGARAFYECTFTSVTLPASLKRIIAVR